MVCMSPLDRLPPDSSPAKDSAGRRRARWADLRFVLGVILIAGSIAGVWAVVGLSRQTTPVYVAARTIVPGERVSADDLAVVDVTLGRVAGTYLSTGAVLSDRVADRTIAAGELVPRDARLAKRMTSIEVEGAAGGARCFTTNEADGDVNVLLVESLADAKIPVRPTPPMIDALCRGIPTP